MKSQYLAKSILCHILTSSGISHRALIKHRMQISSLGDDAAHCLSFHKPVWKQTTREIQRDQDSYAVMRLSFPVTTSAVSSQTIPADEVTSSSAPCGQAGSHPSLCWCLLDQQAAFAGKHETAYTLVIAFNSRRKKEQNKKNKNPYLNILFTL